MSPTQVAILGCGPAGLLAAHAVLLAGHEPRIFSKKQKSQMPGTQYLHQPIPELTANEPDGMVRYVKHGTKQGYATKVYGSPDAPCSWTKFGEGVHEIWSLGSMYDKLWEVFDDSIKDYELGPGSISALFESFPLVISSIPAPRLCHYTEHTFKNQTIWICTEHPEADVIAFREVNENVIMYDGSDDHHWYRASHIFGKYAVETTDALKASGWLYGHKPVMTDCDCHITQHRGRFFRVGRFGRWKKGVLTHHAFWDTVEILDKTIGRKVNALL